MKHLALKVRSMNTKAPYTAYGLGDRIHSLLMTYQYGKRHNTPMTLHITDDKWSISRGVPSDNKIKSWPEILTLFPKGSVFVKNWPVETFPTEEGWIRYLKDKGIEPLTYYYKDTHHMHPYQTVQPLDISDYLKILPELTPIDCSKELILPEKFITAQFDTLDKSRTFTSNTINKIYDAYNKQGYEVVIVGGGATNPLLKRLKYAGFSISKAAYHIGADSGFMHLAQIYKPYNQIHLYNEGHKGHHYYRALANGTKLNVHLGN